MTSRRHTSLPDTSPEFFDRLYRNSEDPWNFRHSTYERSRYEAIVDAVNDKHYGKAFEPGCANGELTALLAPFCESLEALDCSAAAVEIARSRCRNYPQVNIRQGILPADLPTQACDLIVLSEVGYYFTREDLASMIAQLWSRLEPGGRLIACHWLGHSEDHQLHGSDVHETIDQVLNARGDLSTLNSGYSLQRWSK